VAASVGYLYKTRVKEIRNRKGFRRVTEEGYLNVGKSLYTVLDRLEDRQLITKRRSKTDARRWVYCLPYHTTNDDNTTKEDGLTIKDSPPPSHFSGHVELVSENITGKEKEDIQHLFNTHSTVIQHPENVDRQENPHNYDRERNTAAQQVIQQTTKDEGERVGVEQVHCERVLQIERQVDLSTTTEDTSSQTDFLDQTSQQEAFQQKYQPVEVLNHEGEWISGYYVHKCLVVANLEGVERKYALHDEGGDKYVFWGEIRLPRSK
jgi:hypothetical protein